VSKGNTLKQILPSNIDPQNIFDLDRLMIFFITTIGEVSELIQEDTVFKNMRSLEEGRRLKNIRSKHS
jgi:hypothetical protein